MYTIVVDERERERQFENGINKAVRHCKIGKVTRKLPHVTDEMRNAFRGARCGRIWVRRFRSRPMPAAMSIPPVQATFRSCPAG